jgi:hypothetical protein
VDGVKVELMISRALSFAELNLRLRWERDREGEREEEEEEEDEYERAARGRRGRSSSLRLPVGAKRAASVVVVGPSARRAGG